MDATTRLEHLAAIVQGSDDAIVSKDLSGIIQTWNPGAERMFGFTPEEAIGHPMTIIFPPERIPEEAFILSQIRAGNRLEHYETVRRRKDGRLLDVSVTVSPIRDSTGRIAGASKIARDVTERKKLEAVQRDLNQRLQRIDRERRDFLNLVAHELRTPLTPIRMQLEMMADSEESPERRQALALIDRNVARLGSLVEQLLVLSRTGMQPSATLVETDICTLIEENVHIFAAAARKREIALEIKCADPLPVSADPDRLAQVVTNLVGNALKFTGPGGRVSARTWGDDGSAWLEVADTGMGFGPGEAEALFQPFTRLHHEVPGTGLGLYISRAIARQHGGELYATSPGPGKGASFRLRLPLAGPAGSPRTGPA